MISLNTKTPMTTPVKGSTVLSMEARSPPMIKVPIWNAARAPTLTRMASRMHRIQPITVAGSVKHPVARHTTSITTEHTADT